MGMVKYFELCFFALTHTHTPAASSSSSSSSDAHNPAVKWLSEDPDVRAAMEAELCVDEALAGRGTDIRTRTHTMTGVHMIRLLRHLPKGE
jgi:hypothetical protein